MVPSITLLAVNILEHLLSNMADNNVVGEEVENSVRFI